MNNILKLRSILIGMSILVTNKGFSKTSEEASIYVITVAMRIFYEKNPTETLNSWELLHQKSTIRKIEFDQINKQLNLVTNYKFPINLEKPIRSYSGPALIVAIEKNSGGEGDKKSENNETIPGRVVFFKLPSNTISMGKYTEESLEVIFKEAGYNLKDYTGENGKWINSGSVLNVPKDKDTSNQHTTQNLPAERSSDKSLLKTTESQSKSNKFLSFLFGIVILLFCSGMIYFIKNRKV